MNEAEKAVIGCLLDSMCECSRFLGRNPGYVGTCLLRGKDAVSKSGKKYKIIFQD